jgi:hypothetical protein
MRIPRSQPLRLNSQQRANGERAIETTEALDRPPLPRCCWVPSAEALVCRWAQHTLALLSLQRPPSADSSVGLTTQQVA